MFHLVQKTQALNMNQVRAISTTSANFLNQRLRMKKGLPFNPNTCGVLTDGQDYSYLDGRPTPCGARQKRRIVQQKELAEKIIQYTKEIDFAVDRHKQLQLDEEKRKQDIIDSKLKPKGMLLLKRSKK